MHLLLSKATSLALCVPVALSLLAVSKQALQLAQDMERKAEQVALIRSVIKHTLTLSEYGGLLGGPVMLNKEKHETWPEEIRNLASEENDALCFLDIRLSHPLHYDASDTREIHLCNSGAEEVKPAKLFLLIQSQDVRLLVSPQAHSFAPQQCVQTILKLSHPTIADQLVWLPQLSSNTPIDYDLPGLLFPVTGEYCYLKDKDETLRFISLLRGVLRENQPIADFGGSILELSSPEVPRSSFTHSEITATITYKESRPTRHALSSQITRSHPLDVLSYYRLK